MCEISIILIFQKLGLVEPVQEKIKLTSPNPNRPWLLFIDLVWYRAYQTKSKSDHRQSITPNSCT